MARYGKAGAPISVVAVEFACGVAVIRNGSNQHEPERFDPKTLGRGLVSRSTFSDNAAVSSPVRHVVCPGVGEISTSLIRLQRS
jgi:hypothetical protein